MSDKAKQVFFLRSEEVKLNAVNFLAHLPVLPKGECWVVEFKPLTRTLAQNAKLHAMLGDITQQADFKGEPLILEQWKMLFVSGHAVATGRPHELVIGFEGELVNLRESTAQMGVKRLISLIDYIDAWAAENNVIFKESRNYYGW